MNANPKNRVRDVTTPIPIRLDDATIARLDRAASKMASNRAAVIRLAIIQILPDIEAGQINLKATVA